MRAARARWSALLVRPGPLARPLEPLPGFLIEHDPMYASLFLANLGSVGVSDAFHHLYEYGNVSIFGAVSAVRRAVFAERTGPVVDEALSVRWTFDERIDDAFSAARSLALVQHALEDPERWLGPPEGDPAWRRRPPGPGAPRRRAGGRRAPPSRPGRAGEGPGDARGGRAAPAGAGSAPAPLRAAHRLCLAALSAAGAVAGLGGPAPGTGPSLAVLAVAPGRRCCSWPAPARPAGRSARCATSPAWRWCW